VKFNKTRRETTVKNHEILLLAAWPAGNPLSLQNAYDLTEFGRHSAASIRRQVKPLAHAAASIGAQASEPVVSFGAFNNLRSKRDPILISR
jgi:hypothetical protein